MKHQDPSVPNIGTEGFLFGTTDSRDVYFGLHEGCRNADSEDGEAGVEP